MAALSLATHRTAHGSLACLGAVCVREWGLQARGLWVPSRHVTGGALVFCDHIPLL